MSQTELMGRKNHIVSDCVESYIQNDLHYKSQVSKFHMILLVFFMTVIS